MKPSIMRFINYPIIALCALVVFIALCNYSWNRPMVVVKMSQQHGYMQGANSFVGFKLDHFTTGVTTYHKLTPAEFKQAMNELYGDQK